MYFLVFRYTVQFVCARWTDGPFAQGRDPYKKCLIFDYHSIVYEFPSHDDRNNYCLRTYYTLETIAKYFPYGASFIPQANSILYFLLFSLYIQGSWGMRVNFPQVTPRPAWTSESALPPEKADDVGQWCVSILQMKKVEAPDTMNKNNMLQSWK